MFFAKYLFDKLTLKETVESNIYTKYGINHGIGLAHCASDAT